jgi:hypothetical protein
MDTRYAIKMIARVGYAAKCVVYCILGVLTIYTAFSAARADEVSKKSVFQEILSVPFGTLSLTAITIGLACYVTWRVVQGITNPGNLDMNEPKEVLMRIFYFFSAIAYGLATYVAMKVLMGSSDNSQQQQVSDNILQETWGALLVGTISLAIIVFAFIQLKHAMKVDFMDKFVASMSRRQRKLAEWSGRLGFACRGVIYLIVGGFFVNASITQNSEKAGGLAEALKTLIVQPFGPWLVAAVGIGLIGFGVFCGLEGRYRKTD